MRGLRARATACSAAAEACGAGATKLSPAAACCLGVWAVVCELHQPLLSGAAGPPAATVRSLWPLCSPGRAFLADRLSAGCCCCKLLAAHGLFLPVGQSATGGAEGFLESSLEAASGAGVGEASPGRGRAWLPADGGAGCASSASALLHLLTTGTSAAPVRLGSTATPPAAGTSIKTAA